MLTKFLGVLYFWGFVNAAVSSTHLNLSNYYKLRNDWEINRNKLKQNDDYRSQLIKNALELLNKEKNDLKEIAINKCLDKNYELRSRMKCVKELISRTNYKREGYNPIHINKYSNEYDYYDFQDLTKKRIDRSYNQYNFSQDYLDVKDLLRTGSGSHDSNKKNTKKRYVLKIVQPNKYNRFDYDLTRFRRFNRNDNKNILRTNSESSESSDSSEENEELKIQDKSVKRYIEDSDELSSSDEDSEKTEPKLKTPSVMYMQSPSRLFGAESRRRLPHFLPKRYHWDEDEMKDLTNYWFNVRQGRYSGAYKTPY